MSGSIKCRLKSSSAAKGRLSQSAGTTLQLRVDKGQPDIADHSHSWAQPRGWAARMVLKIVFYVLFYYRGKFVICERGHIQETCTDRISDLKTPKRVHS